MSVGPESPCTRAHKAKVGVGAAGFGTEFDPNSLPAKIPWQMLSRGLDSLLKDSNERRDVESRACALLLQAHECSGGNLPTALGSLAMAIAPHSRFTRGESTGSCGSNTVMQVSAVL